MKNLIGNRWLNSSNNSTIDVLSPASNAIIDKIPNSTPEDVEQIVELASLNQQKWANTPIEEKIEIIQRFISNVEDDITNLKTTLSNETGMTLLEAEVELENLIKYTNLLCEYSKLLSNKNMPTNISNETDELLYVVKRESIGIVGSILPFNESISMFAKTVISALLMGNAVVVKPSSRAPLTVITLVYLLVKSGVTIGAIGVINGDGVVTGRALSLNKKIGLITISGVESTITSVIAGVSINKTDIYVEAPRRNVMIVLNDSNLNKVVDDLVKNRLFNAGQTNFAIKTVYVQSEVKDKFLNLLIEKLKVVNKKEAADDKINLGYLINERASSKVEEQIANFKKEGARLFYGGRKQGSFVEPTIISELDINSYLLSEDIFGPVFPIVTFADINEVLNYFNAINQNITASIYTENMNFAISHISKINFEEILINKVHNIYTYTVINSTLSNKGFRLNGIEGILDKMSKTKIAIIKENT